MKNYVFYNIQTGIIKKNLRCSEAMLMLNQEPDCSYIEHDMVDSDEKIVDIATKQVIDRIFTPQEIVDKVRREKIRDRERIIEDKQREIIRRMAMKELEDAGELPPEPV